jgi:hypothetical protein
MMIKKIVVNEVKEPPEILVTMQGIRSKEEAEHWAEKNGFTTVYWLKNRQRVYAFRHSVQPVSATQQMLFSPSESGQGLVEYLMIIAFVVVVVFFVLKNWPW